MKQKMEYINFLKKILLQYILMAVILIVETKFLSREKTYITYRSNTNFYYDVDKINKLYADLTPPSRPTVETF